MLRVCIWELKDSRNREVELEKESNTFAMTDLQLKEVMMTHIQICLAVCLYAYLLVT